jgi:hypothetical protein
VPSCSTVVVRHRRAVASTHESPCCHLALLSAALFGVSAPAVKALLGSVDPTILAGLLYCGAELGVAILRRLGRSVISQPDAPEVALGRKDLPWLASAIVAGGI